MPGRKNSLDAPGLKITLAKYHDSLKKASVMQSLKVPTTKSTSPVGTVQWEAMMKKFSQAHVETCRKLPDELVSSVRDEKNFPTGSSYDGLWNALGMSGYGVYKFPNSGVIYVGDFDDGMFHGNGELRYESGAVLKGKWHKGRVVEKTLVFDDGLEYAERDWQYIRGSDRRFTVEIKKGVEPAGRSHLTAEAPPPEIPPGFYDVGDGLYNPVTKLVYNYGYSDAKKTKIIRTMTSREHAWVMSNCRTNPQKSVGPCQFLYEDWQWPSLTAPAVPPPPTPIYRDKDIPVKIAPDVCDVYGADCAEVVSGTLFRDSGARVDLRSVSTAIQTQQSSQPQDLDNDDETAQYGRDLIEIVKKQIPFPSSTVFIRGENNSTIKSTINW